MQNTLKTATLTLSRLDIATYTQFQQEMYRMLTESKLNLNTQFRITQSDMRWWQERIEVLVDVNKVIRATVNTEKLAEQDTLRDRIISRLFSGIKYGLDSFTTSEVEAAKRLDLIRKKYTGIQKLNYDRQTASVDGLLKDLSTAEAVADLSRITGLTDLVTRLSAANADFRKLYGETSDTRSAAQLPTFAELRAELTPFWNNVIEHLKAGYIFAEAANRPAIEQLADAMNQRMKQIRDAYNRSQGISGGGSKPGKNSGGGTTPSQPEEEKADGE